VPSATAAPAESATPASPQAAAGAETGAPAPVDFFAQLWRRLHEHKVIQWGLAYLGTALALAHGQELIGHTFGWPEVIGRAWIGVLILGFPVALVFAWYHGHKGLKSFSPAEMTIVAMLMLIGAGGLILFVHPPPEHLPAETEEKSEQASVSAPLARDYTGATVAPRGTTISEIAALVQKDRYGEAFALALPLIGAAQAKTEPELAALWRQLNLPMRPLISEAGATVYFKPYEDVDGEWIKAGVTPITKAADAPRGVLRLKVEKPGFVTGHFTIHNPSPSVENDPPDPEIAGISFAKVPLPLAAEGMIADDMVVVPHTNIPVYVTGLGGTLNRGGASAQYDIPAFAIAKREVTNQEFKAFVDAGGYDNPTYWEGLKFEDNGRALTWEEARRRFVDKTNRPGPAGWQLSTYPVDQADMPVGGISWYEAVAYARFRGLALPTVHHWARAAFAPHEGWFNTAPAISIASRFSAAGPLPADSEVGLGPWGTVHMAGNVREWVWNFAGARALSQGGAWNDYASLYQTIYTVSPMQRAPENGMRLMQPLASADMSAELLKPVTLAESAGPTRVPVSDEAFQAMRFQFTSAHAKPKETQVQQVQETPLWIAEEVILRFANQETTTLYIVRPKSHRNPLQPVIYGPPGDCCSFGKRPNRNALEQMRPPADTIVQSGRALVIPIWAASYERAFPPQGNPDGIADAQRRAALAWYQDVSLVLDYLETRPDIDVYRAGYMGFSYGTVVGSVVLATEGRLKTGVLISGGLVPEIHPMADAINYAQRIKIPVLMVNGRYDNLFPYETAQKPMFDLLGAPADQKSHLVYDVGHFAFPSNSIAMEISNWFDKYLGPVR
jgi:formylglycine-generating enzyme required for sulfatase activity/dienelactone hydrolase